MKATYPSMSLINRPSSSSSGSCAAKPFRKLQHFTVYNKALVYHVQFSYHTLNIISCHDNIKIGRIAPIIRIDV